MPPGRRPVARVALWAVAILLLAALVAIGRPAASWLQTDILALLPQPENDPWQTRAEAELSARYNGQLVLRVAGENAAAVANFSQQAQQRLAEAGYLPLDDAGQQQEQRWRALSQLLSPYRWSLLTEADRSALTEDPGAFMARYQNFLYSPLGSSALQGLQWDPLGLFRNFLEAAGNAPLATNGVAAGNATATGEFSELTALTLRRDRLGLAELQGLYRHYLELKGAAAQQELRFQASGAALYSAFGADSARREISTIGLSSLLLLTLLLGITLRSGRALLLTAICVGTGMGCGLLITILALGEIHLLTLVFGASLIGIAADYALHYLAHSLMPGWTRDTAWAVVGRGLCLGALSSAVAFAALALLPFPGIRQIGIFMAAGLLASFATVWLLFPAAYPGPRAPRRLPRFCRWQPRRWHQVKWLALPVGALILPGLLLLQASDEIRDFYARPASLAADEAAITGAFAGVLDSRYLVLRAPDESSLMALEERVRDAADGLSLAGISQLVPSPERQRQNFNTLRALVRDGGLQTYLENLGMSPSARRGLVDELAVEPPLLRLSVLDASALPLGTGGFLGCHQGECASRLEVRSATLATASAAASLARLTRQFPTVTLVDRVGAINRLLGQYRGAVLAMLAVSGVAAVAVLALTIGWRPGLRVVALPFSACLLSLATIGYLHGQYSIVNLLALLLIVGVGLDYGVFRALTPAAEQAATTLAIALSALTSVFAFGMLGFSSTPVISAFGQTIAIGLGFAYALSWIGLAPELRR